MVIETLGRQLDYVFRWYEKKEKKPPPNLCLQLDNASDNKSILMLAYCCALVHYQVFLSVSMCFLLRGHTHNCCDQCFSVIERRLRLSSTKP